MIDANTAAHDGGGIFSLFAPVTVINSTISNNSATSGAGGFFNEGGVVTILSGATSWEIGPVETEQVVYLDFDGHTTGNVQGTSWDNLTSAVWDLSGNGASFTTTEQQVIQRIWARVAEDFAPFNEVWRRFFPHDPPATTLIPMPSPGLVIAHARQLITCAGAAPRCGANQGALDAISDGLREAMRADPSVILLGQDIADYGGVFKVTDGFVAEFGKQRVRNTPIVESAALGCALGLALDGFHPMVEMQFADFISCGFNQIVNNLATTHYRWAAAVRVVIRAPVGGGVAAGSLGIPDLGISTLDDVLIDVRRITDVCSLPLLVDVDTGFGASAFNVARTVKSPPPSRPAARRNSWTFIGRRTADRIGFPSLRPIPEAASPPSLPRTCWRLPVRRVSTRAGTSSIAAITRAHSGRPPTTVRLWMAPTLPSAWPFRRQTPTSYTWQRLPMERAAISSAP